MIESRYWKESLKRFIPRIARVKNPPRWTDRLQEELDRDLFLCFFQIRKMWERNKLSDEADNLKIKVYRSQAVKEIHYLNSGCLDENYDFENEKNITLSLNEICHQFVHSKMLWTMRDETRNWGWVHSASNLASHLES